MQHTGATEWWKDWGGGCEQNGAHGGATDDPKMLNVFLGSLDKCRYVKIQENFVEAILLFIL